MIGLRTPLRARKALYLPPPGAGCVLWLPGQDDAYSGTIRDRSGNGNNGTITGATWIRANSGLRVNDFDGDDLVNLDTVVGDLAATTQGTILVWVKMPDATPLASNMIFTFGDTDANETIYLRINSTALWGGGCIDAGVTKWAVATDAAAISDNIWVQLGVTHNGTAPTLYVNGVAVAQTFTTSVDNTAWFSVLTGIDNGRMGCINYNSAGNATFLTGSAILLRAFTTALSASEILGYYNNERGMFQ